MDAIIIQIASAVVDQLNNATLSQSFTAVRSYAPVHNIKELVDLEVSVIPETRTSELLDRSGRAFNDYVISVGIQKSLPHGTLTDDQINAACDPLMFLAEEIVALFYINVLGGYPAARCTNVHNTPVFAEHHIDQERLFTSVINLTFRVGT